MTKKDSNVIKFVRNSTRMKTPLIETSTNESGEVIVSGRELHEFLEVGTRYDKWFSRMVEYGFTENIDFVAIAQKRPTAQGNETTFTDHALKIDMAKEISMIQRNDKGKQARQYFLEIEKLWNSPEMVMKRALEYADAKIKSLTTENEVLEHQVKDLKPKAEYTDIILKNKGLVTVTSIAKDYGMSAEKFNMLLHDLGIQYKQSKQWFLYSKYHDKGYTHSETIPITRSDGTPDIRTNTKWTQSGRFFLYEKLKEKDVLPMIEREFEEAE